MMIHEDIEQALVKETLIKTEIPLIICRMVPFGILYVSQAIKREWRFYADITAEAPDRITEVIYPEDRAAFIEKVMEAPLNYCDELIEFRVAMPNEQQKWYGLRLYPLQLQGKMNYVAGFVEDITERKNRETQLQAKYGKLEDYVHMVRHDLKGMIGNIQIINNLIREKITAKEPEELASYFELISKICREAICHTAELSERFFLPSEDLTLEKEEVDLTEEVFQAVDLYRAQLEYKKLTMKVLLSEGKMVVQADKMKFWQIIQNLMSNAIKFSHENGQITIALKNLRDFILLEVSDIGIGIPPAFHPFIFQKHSQAMRKGTKGEKPTGMGTYIIKQMVEAHDGEVWFESEEGMGTTFFVKLPK